VIQVFGGEVNPNQADPASEDAAPGPQSSLTGVALSLSRSGGVA
jgi:hypothetical protein